MAYEKVSGVRVVILGGVNKQTGTKNPTELEGYFLRTEQRTTKYCDKDFYVFLTEEGEAGVFTTAWLGNEMKKAKVNTMTKVVATGKTMPSDKGNPIKIFDVFQDKNNTIDPQLASAYASSPDSSYEENEEDEPSQSTSTATVSSSNKTSVDAYLSARKAKTVR